ncbi:hypothetical protein F4604DRAFT_931691 [Suillus subluteus]|nr:hypothetical protein F4604DRAFT_931691 [Suillus subluteus]
MTNASLSSHSFSIYATSLSSNSCRSFCRIADAPSVSHFLSYIARPKSFLPIPLSPFTFFLLSSDPSHSFVYPFRLSFSYCRPTQVAPSCTPFIFLYVLRHLTLLPSLEPARSPFHSAPDSGSLRACTAPFTHHYLLAAPYPAYFIISALDFAHSRTTVYMQFQPISLSLPQTSPIHAPRFTRSSSLFNYLCPGLRPFAHHGLHAAPAYSFISAPDFAHSRTTVYMQLQPIPKLFLTRTLPFAHHGLHAAPAYYITTFCPHRHFTSNGTPSATLFTRDFMISMSGSSTTHLMTFIPYDIFMTDDTL